MPLVECAEGIEHLVQREQVPMFTGAHMIVLLDRFPCVPGLTRVAGTPKLPSLRKPYPRLPMSLRFLFAFVLLAAPALAHDDSMLTLPIRFHITQWAAGRLWSESGPTNPLVERIRP